MVKQEDVAFRRADLIELHDAGAVLHTHNYADERVGWRECMDVDREVQIQGTDLGRLFGGERGWTAINVLLRRLEVGDGYAGEAEGGAWIEALEAAIVEPDRLEIRATLGSGLGGEVWQQTISYLGAYSVWWSSDAGDR